MEIANHQKAEILARALPYIQMYRKKVIVVKYGGNAMICLLYTSPSPRDS